MSLPRKRAAAMAKTKFILGEELVTQTRAMRVAPKRRSPLRDSILTNFWKGVRKRLGMEWDRGSGILPQDMPVNPFRVRLSWTLWTISGIGCEQARWGICGWRKQGCRRRGWGR